MTREGAATWSNWTGIETCTPREVLSPRDAGQVQDAVRAAVRDRTTVRAVGSGHSFTGAAVAPGVQLRLDHLSRLLDVDTASGLVRVEAGIPLRRLNALLAEHGLAMPNLGDIDRQTITGAISTGTHGTGATLPGLAAQVRALSLVTGDGELRRYDEADPDLLDAARVSVGALGVVTELTLQTVPAFALMAVESPAPLAQVVESLDTLVDEHDHFEFYWFPHTDRTLTKANDRVPADVPLRPVPRWRHLLEDELLSNAVFEGLNRFAARVPSAVPRLNAVAARALSAREYVDASHHVFVSPRRVRFNESEYAVPRAAVPDVLAELKAWVDSHDERLPFPVEVRFAAADSGWLSTGHERANGYLAVHQYHRMPHQRYFAAFEAIVAEHAGRPHWGKLHTLGAAELGALYPRFDDFVRLRDELDQGRVFANPYTVRVFGE